ncbi:hypothetical protein WAI453_008171 [Rhynchosporium graminicola]
MQNYRNFMPTLNNHQLQVLRESQNAAQDIEKNLLVATSSTPTRTRELAQAQSFRRIMVSTTETVASFIEAKQRQLEADYAFKQAERNFLKEALDQKVISKAQFEDTIKEIPSQKAVDEVRDQLVVLRGDRKFVEDDMRDRELQKEEFEQGYMSLMIQKVESAQAQKSKQGAISKQLIFRKAVLDRYDGSQIVPVSEQVQHYCMLTGWHPTIGVESRGKAAHLVPRILDGTDLRA